MEKRGSAPLRQTHTHARTRNSHTSMNPERTHADICDKIILTSGTHTTYTALTHKSHLYYTEHQLADGGADYAVTLCQPISPSWISAFKPQSQMSF